MESTGKGKKLFNISTLRIYLPLTLRRPKEGPPISNTTIYILTILAAISLKLYLRIAEHGDLVWFLYPTTKIVELFTGMQFIFDPSIGYIAINDIIVISKECSGVNFFVISLCMITFSFMRYIRKRKLAAFFGFLTATWMVTFGVNASRIIIAIALRDLNSSGIIPDISWMHQAEGITVYFSFLVLYYLLIRSIFLKRRDIIENIS
jgi:exosortase K